MSPRSKQEELTKMLAELSYRHGDFTLASGKKSDFYVDVKQTVYTADGARLIGEVFLDFMKSHGIELVGGMAVGAIPLVDATLNAAARDSYPLDGFFVRKEAKSHGTAAAIDGRFDAGKKIALLEDVVTTGASTLRAVELVRDAGGEVAVIGAVVDREEDDGIQALETSGAVVFALCTRTEIVGAAS